MQSLLAGFLANGLDPAAVADRVCDAVLAERFWVLTHDAEDNWMTAVRCARQLRHGRHQPWLCRGVIRRRSSGGGGASASSTNGRFRAGCGFVSPRPSSNSTTRSRP